MLGEGDNYGPLCTDEETKQFAQVPHVGSGQQGYEPDGLAPEPSSQPLLSVS